MPKIFSFSFLFTAAAFLLSAFPVSAQKNKDSLSTPVDSSRFYYFSESLFAPDTVLRSELYNTLDGFQSYHCRQANTGNIGSAEKMLSPHELAPPGFSRGPSRFDYFGYDNQANRRFFSVKKPYTRIVAILGQKQEQVINVTHAQNFGKDFNIAFGFDRIRSQGFYLRQNTNNTGFCITSAFRGPGRRYAFLTNMYWTKVDVAENGGIVNDDLFENNSSTNRQLVGVKISNAETNEQKRGIWIKQYWAFGSEITDTLSTSDTSKQARTRSRIDPRSALFLITAVEDRDYRYLDSDTSSGVYTNIFRDSLLTDDSTHLLKIDNALGWEFMNRVKAKDFSFSKVSIGIRHQFGKLHNDTIRTTFSDLIGEAALRFSFKYDTAAAVKTPGLSPEIPGIHLDLFSQYVISGTDAGDLRAGLKFTIRKAAGNTFLLSADWTQRQADWLYRHYSGNHFRWQNDFSSTGLLHVSASAVLPGAGLQAGLQLYNYAKPLYFDSTWLPAQWNGNVMIPGAFAQHKLQLGWFNLWTDIRYNLVSDTAVIRLPALVLRESVFANLLLFKNALRMQIGADLFYHSSYFAEDYNPNLAQYQLQHTRSFGNYPFADIWLSIKIKPVRVFVKMEHLNSGLMGYSYYFAQHYPQNDRSLKVGFSWVFND